MVSKAMLVGLIVGAFVLVPGSYGDLQKIGELLEEIKQKIKAPGEHFKNKVAGYNGNFDVNLKFGVPSTGFRNSGGVGQQIQSYGNYYPPQVQSYSSNYYPQQYQGYGNINPPQNQGYINYYPQQYQGYGNYYPAQQGAGYNVPGNGISVGYGVNLGYNPGYQPGYFDASYQAGFNTLGAQQGNGYFPANNIPQGYGNAGYNLGYQPGYVDSSTQTTYNVPLGGVQQPSVSLSPPPIGTGGSSSGLTTGSFTIPLGTVNKPVTGGSAPGTGISG